jgi:transposase
VEKIIRVGMDTSKSVFELHGVNAAEQPALRKRLRRDQLAGCFAQLPPTIIGMEACGGAHHWARVLQALGHEVRLMAPQLVKPYVKRNKNDAADAAAICEAMSRPTMRFVAIKSAEQQTALMLVGVRDQLVMQRTQVANAIRGYAAEFGLVAAKGLDKVEALLARATADETLPALARELFAIQGQTYAYLQGRIRTLEAKLMAWHRAHATSREVAKIPGIGPIGATLMVIKVPEPRAFRSGRYCSAWIGLTPKDHSTAGKTRLGGITRAGDVALRAALVAGATAVIQHERRRKGGPKDPWLRDLLQRVKPKAAAVALANKNARIAWKLMVSGEAYDPTRRAAAAAATA